MGLLFLVVIGISAIILIARLGSKTRRKEEAPLERQNGREKSKIETQRKNYLEEGLVTLLIRKKIITEEELLSEIDLLKKIKEEH